ncbi:peptidylprolyl isomerase [Parabacteroides sp. PF5-9]|uniref:peptidylprolyl isomerase n=1 Tax=Parabacteroides sp. PF5-9 TaxID=1742404 RepID=UPI0024769852|nr:peptidylprolyl isomerase [Parabacteroides sp. PF5-9]MDH6358807.1 peptidyl-prolyl cis-trans isomerase SurA [Parabacteroides sp. PF5-9]
MMKKIFIVFFLTCCVSVGIAQDNVIDEIVWVVGDDAILRSDVESMRLHMQNDGMRLEGDPYCFIPEQMAIQKLYLNQAKIDSIEIAETQIIQRVDAWMSFAESQTGSREKLEEYFNKKYSEIKDERREMVREELVIQQMQQKLIGEIKLTPSEIRRFYNQIPEDSLPIIATTVEVQIITMEPQISFEETDAIKARLREFTDDINNGRMEFSTLARLYSEDLESARRGGELGFTGKANLLPEFANVAFNLNDPKRVSQIVQTEYGFHIIQLIEKRGDRINCRHILLKPKVSETELMEATARLDSVYNDLKIEKFSFEDAATFISYDKDTRNNKGLMVNSDYESSYYGTPKFEMQELPQEIGKIVNNMEVGDISKPFTMITKAQKEVVAIVKLKNRINQHKANMSDDFQALKAMVEAKKREELLDNWIKKKQQSTYVRIANGWSGCDFRYPGWVKE